MGKKKKKKKEKKGGIGIQDLSAWPTLEWDQVHCFIISVQAQLAAA